MTTFRGKSTVASAVLLAIAYIVGCGGGEFYQLGQKAEKKGDLASAYNQYARAAAQDRSGAVRECLARTRAAATAQAERAGLDALDEDRFDDAWRAFMRTLEIQPDHPTAVQLVRQLENEHPREIAGVKREWLTRGSPALSVAEVRVLAMAPPPSLTPRVAVALPPIPFDEANGRPTIPARETTALAALPLREATVPLPTTVNEPAATPKISVQKATAPPVITAPPAKPLREASMPPTTPAQVTSVQPVTTIQKATAPSTMPLRKATVPPVIAAPPTEPVREVRTPLETPTRKETAPPQTIQETATPPTIPVRKATVPSVRPARETNVSPKKPARRVILVSASDPADSNPERPKRARPQPQPQEFDELEPVAPALRDIARTSIYTLSLNDRRYSRMALSVDGIGVRVKDTESTGEADLDLFDGKKRTQKIRDLEVGRSQTFRGKSGALYRLTLLGVHHKSRTVRLGVKRS